MQLALVHLNIYGAICGEIRCIVNAINVPSQIGLLRRTVNTQKWSSGTGGHQSSKVQGCKPSCLQPFLIKKRAKKQRMSIDCQIDVVLFSSRSIVLQKKKKKKNSLDIQCFVQLQLCRRTWVFPPILKVFQWNSGLLWPQKVAAADTDQKSMAADPLRYQWAGLA